MSSDTLSEVLRATRLSGGMFFRIRFAAPYSVTAMDTDSMRAMFAPGADHVLPFHVVTGGSIWFEVPGGPSVLLHEGDVVVFPRGSEHVLTDRPGSPPVPVGLLRHRAVGSPPLLAYGGDGAVGEALCGWFHCHGRLFNPLLDALPEVLVVRRESSRASWLAATMQRTFNETMSERPGSEVLVQRLTELLFLDVVQSHLEEEDSVGWLRGLSHPVVGRALALLHAEPARAWSLDDLARAVGASRSSLSDQFAQSVGMPPLRYLTAWRMELAAQQLLQGEDSVAEVAFRVGYSSEAAFNRAFKRATGEPPATWRRSQAAAVAGP